MQRTLSIGMSGEDVADLQVALNYHLRPPAVPHTPLGPTRLPLKADSVFGTDTDPRARVSAPEPPRCDDAVGPITQSLLTKAKQVTVKIPIYRSEKSSIPANAISARALAIRTFGLSRVEQSPAVPQVG